MKYRQQTYHIGSHDIRLRTLLDLDQFADPEGDARAAGISKEAFPLFGIVWTSSEILAQILLEHDLANRRILEVGCGMALVSHVLNAEGADVTAMDIHPVTEELLFDNVALNGGKRIPFVNCSWAEPDPDLGRFDLMVGSDVLYEPRHIETLPAFFDQHGEAHCEVVIADPGRAKLDVFQQQMASAGFSCEQSETDLKDHLERPYTGAIFHFRR